MSHPRALLAPTLVLLAAACSGGDPDAVAARAALESFQDAVAEADRHALAGLLTTESRPALEQMPLGGRERLLIEGFERPTSGRFEFRVREPDAAPTGTSTFVVVREAGAWRIDLVETLLANHAVQPGEGYRIVPGGLDHERIEGIGAVDAGAIR